jgi:hypothetical protein
LREKPIRRHLIERGLRDWNGSEGRWTYGHEHVGRVDLSGILQSGCLDRLVAPWWWGSGRVRRRAMNEGGGAVEDLGEGVKGSMEVSGIVG